MATYKDLTFHVEFLSKTKSVVLKKDFTVYEFFEPRKVVDYNTEMDIDNQSYQDIVELKWSILGATCK